MRFFFSANGDFQFQSEKILRRGNSPALCEALSLLYTGQSESRIRDCLEKKFSLREAQQVLSYLAMTNQITGKSSSRADHKINYTSFLANDLGYELIERLVSFFSNIGFESKIHFVFISSWKNHFEISQDSFSLICPVVVQTNQIQVGPFLESVSALRNFVDFIFCLSSVFEKIEELSHPVSLNYFTEYQLATIVNMIGTEILNAFDLNRKKTVFHGLKCFDLIENEIVFHKNIWNFHKTRTIELVDQSYSSAGPAHESIGTVVYTDGGYRVCSPEKTLENIVPFLEGKLGILKHSKEYNVFNNSTFSIFYASTIPLITESNIVSTKVEHQAYGKGQTRAQSKLSCYAELIERYQVGIMDPIQVLLSTHKDIAGMAFGPQELEPYSLNQIVLSASLPESKSSIPSVEYKNEKIYWVPSYCLVNEKTFWLPFSYCIKKNLRDETKPFEDSFCSLNSSGFSSGNSAAEAIIQGAFELIERDHASIWWYNKLVMPEIVLESFHNSYFSEVTELLVRENKRVRVLDLTMDIGVHVVAAIIETNTGKLSSVGLGAHIDIEIALSRALTEGLQIMAVPGLFKDCLLKIDSMPDLDKKYLKNSTVLRNKNDYSIPRPVDIGQALQMTVELFKRNGLCLLVQDYSLHELKDFFVMRVVSPGLSCLRKQLSNKRLFEVPFKLKLIPTVNHESDLNPISFDL